MVDRESLTIRLELLELDHWVGVKELRDGAIIEFSDVYYRMKTKSTIAHVDEEVYKESIRHIRQSVTFAREITKTYPLAIEIQYPIKDDK